MRSTRDLMRRRNYFMRKRAELFTHAQNTASQYNLQETLGRISNRPKNRENVISRFPRVQNFGSYSRLVKCAKESNGKKYGSSGKKIGNAHLRWSFSQAAQLFLKGNEPGQKYYNKLCNKHGKGKALSILAHKLGRAVYHMLKTRKVFDMKAFLAVG